MPIETFETTKTKFKDRDAYVERYPLSDDGLYRKYKELKKPQMWQRAFIEWYESGFKPKSRPHMDRMRHLIFEFKRIGYTYEQFRSLFGNEFRDDFYVALWRNTKIMGEKTAQEHYERIMRTLPERTKRMIEPFAQGERVR